MVFDTTQARAASEKRGIGDSSEDNDDENRNPPALDTAAFVDAITSAVITVIAATIAATAPTLPRLASSWSVSTAIDPFDTHSMNFDTRDGKSQWYKSKEAADDWKRIAIVTANDEKITNLIEDCTTTYEFGSLINIPTLGTGTADATPIVVSGVDVWSADIKDKVNILLQTHLVILEHV